MGCEIDSVAVQHQPRNEHEQALKDLVTARLIEAIPDLRCRYRAITAAEREVNEFAAFALERGMTIQILDSSHILVGYQGRWEIFFKEHDGQSPFRQIWHMLCSAHWVEPYLPDDDFVKYTKEQHGYHSNLETAWEEWKEDKSYYCKYQSLLEEDFDLFVEKAMEV